MKVYIICEVDCKYRNYNEEFREGSCERDGPVIINEAGVCQTMIPKEPEA